MDKGHKKLVEDFGKLFIEINDKQFHDYVNTKYAMPKVELVNKLNDLATKVKEGYYDN